jgi:multiple sugar transport system permease protein
MASVTSRIAAGALRRPRGRWRPGSRAKDPAPLGMFGIRSRKKTRLVLAVLFAAVSVFPLLFMISLSFQPASDVFSGTPVLLPSRPTTGNYAVAWNDNSFGHFFANSLYVSLGTVLLTVVLASLAAFAFARFRFPLRETTFYAFLASLAVPGVLLIIPQYLLMSRLHLIDSLNGLILIYVSQNLPFSIFLLRGFFEAIPRELEESFRVEGAGNLKVLTRLIAPLSVPALATVALFTFNAAWDEFIIALILINTPAHRTLPIGLALFIGAHTTAWGPLFAGSVIATIPSIVVYLAAQRWFRHGISLGGLR